MMRLDRLVPRQGIATVLRKLLRELGLSISSRETGPVPSPASMHGTSVVPETAGDVSAALAKLAPTLAASAPTPEVQRLLVTGLVALSQRTDGEEGTDLVAFLLGTALLSVGNLEGALACARARRQGPTPGADALVLPVERSLPAYCRREGLPVIAVAEFDVVPMSPEYLLPAAGTESFVCQLPDARVLGMSYIPVAADGTAFTERCVHRPEKYALQEANAVLDTVVLGTHDRLLASASGEDYHAGEHVLLGSSDNIGHWLLNYFPRLMFAPHIPGFEHAKVVVGSDVREMHLECLAAAGIGPERVVRLAPGRIARFESLWVPSMPYGSVDGPVICWTPKALEFVRETIGMVVPAERARRVFITRAGARWRRLVNEAEVLHAIADLGFEVVDPGALGLREQVALAGSARVIAGTMGAGMNLLMFAAPGTAVVTLKGPIGGVMDIDPFLTTALSLPYVPVVGRLVDSDPDLLKRGIEVDPAAVREALLRAIALAG